MPEEEAKQKLPDFPEPPEVPSPRLVITSTLDLTQHLQELALCAAKRRCACWIHILQPEPAAVPTRCTQNPSAVSQIVGPVQVARRSDVDMNQHLNNVTYLAWCLETVPLDVYTSCQLHQVRARRLQVWSLAPTR